MEILEIELKEEVRLRVESHNEKFKQSEEAVVSELLFDD